MTYYQTLPKIIRRLLSKTLIGTILLLAGFFGFTDVAIQHNQALYDQMAQRVAESTRVRGEQEKIKHSKVVTACRAVCNMPPPKEVKRVPIRQSAQTGVTRLADLKGKIKNPNSIRISLAEAPSILSKTKKVNGKYTCGKKNDKGHKSNKYNKTHVDQQCCLDPDEIPNPRCAY
jgi:hypothetical protein